jgi:hypothetical protein
LSGGGLSSLGAEAGISSSMGMKPDLRINLEIRFSSILDG